MPTHLKEDMGMMPPTGDLACFIKLINENLSCMIETYVYNTIATDNTNFEKESRLTERTFDSKSRIYDSFIFAGIQIKIVGNNFLLNRPPTH